MTEFVPPPRDCPLCPRLAAFRAQNEVTYPHFFNGAVPPFGGLEAKLLIVGLAPGLKGANATGRPFTGDFAGDVLYPALLRAGLASGHNGVTDQSAAFRGQGAVEDDLRLKNCRITNAVRCVPPENKPTPGEIATCNGFLHAEIAAMPNLKLVLSLGLVSHNAVLKATGQKAAKFKFAHGALHDLGSVQLLNSYHTSRYNMNTNRLTVAMFDAIIEKAATFVS